MTIQEIFALESISEIIDQLKKRITELPNIDECNKQWDITKHDIHDKSIRPDKTVNVTDKDGIVTGTRIEKVARVAVALQKLIIGRAAAFAFGNAPKITTDTLDENEKNVFNACLKILKDNKSLAHNKRMAKDAMRFKEAAECWYPRPEDNKLYGFDAKFKIKVSVFSAENGDTLYPLFDEYKDMVAFSRMYLVKEDANEVEYFETYTKDLIIKWKRDGGGWAEMKRSENIIGKIPIVYVTQNYVEYADVQNLIDEFEKLLSRFSDTVAYHGSPKIFTTGQIFGFAKKGEEGAIIQGDKDATAQYLAWPFAPEAVKLEIDTLLRLIFMISQTPDISFDAVKGLGQIAEKTLKLLFLDAHLKVEDKKEIYLDMLQRRMNILKAFVGQLNKQWVSSAGNLAIEVNIDPYMPGDLAADIQNLTNATGGKAIISQKTAVAKSGLVTDAEAEYKQIQEEDSVSNVRDLFQPTV